MPDPLRPFSNLCDKILGRALRSSEGSKEALTVLTGVPVLGLDALASTAYGPEAALAILAPLGIAGLHYMPMVTLGVLALLTTLYMSYRQTAAAYPDGGGAYNVAKDNLGIRAAVIAGASLMLDYILNVAVGVSAGVGAVVSAMPSLQRHTLALCLIVLVALTILNLRGVRETGAAFGIPVLAFLVCLGGAVVFGLVRSCMSGGHPQPVVAPPPMQGATETASLWLILRAFASGCTAMTGVEAVSNGVPLFSKPPVPKAQWTLTIIVAVLGAFLLALSFLSPAYHLHAMDERQPGYQTVLSQLVAAVAGRGPFYYFSIATIFFILACSAQTSFADFPRVCRLLADDGFLPSFFANRGRRLVYSSGIVVLALLSGLLLIGFDGVTDSLIPLFAIGAFSAFAFSQIGMVGHWKRKGGPGSRTKLAVNAIGAVTTCVALVIIVVAKFTEGAWITMVAGPGLVWMFWASKHHYEKLLRELDRPVNLQTGGVRQPVVIVPFDGWNCVTAGALRFGLQMSDDVTALHISTEGSDDAGLRELWAEKVEKPARAAGAVVPRLEIIQSAYRKIYEPILKFVHKKEKDNKDRIIAVVLPELVEPLWYEYLLHNLYGGILRALLLFEGDRRTVVMMTPWHLKEE
jgi:amino acid transporter